MAALRFGKLEGMLHLNIPAVATRGFHTTSVSCLMRVRAGRYKVSKKLTNALTYEQAKPPYLIGIDKAWNTWNTSNLFEEGRKGETLAEDTFIRNFLHGTLHNLIATEIIIKRRHNMIFITGLIVPKLSAIKFHFMVGYTEEILSCLLKCPVKLEFDFVFHSSMVIFKKI